MGLQALAWISSGNGLLLSHEGRLDEALGEALYGSRAVHSFAGYADINLIGLMVAGASQSISLMTLE